MFSFTSPYGGTGFATSAAALAVEDDRVRAVPGLDYVEALVDLRCSAQLCRQRARKIIFCARLESRTLVGNRRADVLLRRRRWSETVRRIMAESGLGDGRACPEGP